MPSTEQLQHMTTIPDPVVTASTLSNRRTKETRPQSKKMADNLKKIHHTKAEQENQVKGVLSKLRCTKQPPSILSYS